MTTPTVGPRGEDGWPPSRAPRPADPADPLSAPRYPPLASAPRRAPQLDPPTIPDNLPPSPGSAQPSPGPWPYPPQYGSGAPQYGPMYGPASGPAYGPGAPLHAGQGGPQPWPPQSLAVVPVPPRTPPRWVTRLARPIPMGLALGGVGALLVVLALVFLSGEDWGDGAARAGVASGILAVLGAILVGARFFAARATGAGSRAIRQFVADGLLVVVLLATFAAGIGSANPLHRSEGGLYEAQRQWQHAIAEYTRGGETGANAADVARVYDKWGEQLSASGAYGPAIDKFQLVLTVYSSAPQADTRAQTDLIGAYLAWSQQALQQQDDASAMQRLDTLLALAYCTPACQTQGAALDATAYYAVAEAKLAAGDFQGAVDTFHVLLNRFVGAPEVAKAHGDVARALLGLGQQQLAGAACSSAVPTYQELAGSYADTPQGRQARGALAAPQSVKGRFPQWAPGAGVALAQGLRGGISDNAFLHAIQVAENRGLVKAVNSDGTFLYPAVAQGTYDLAWFTSDDNGVNYRFAYNADGSPAHVAQVGPLCPVDLGSIDEAFPPPYAAVGPAGVTSRRAQPSL